MLGNKFAIKHKLTDCELVYLNNFLYCGDNSLRFKNMAAQKTVEIYLFENEFFI